MQNKMLRFILKLRPRSHIGDEELKLVGMLKVEDRVPQRKLNNVNSTMSLKFTMNLHLSTGTVTSPN